MKQLFVAWVAFQRRTVSMEPYFGYNLEFISFAFKNRLLRPVEYILKAGKTLILFLHRQPEVIWVQLPPNFLLHLAYLYKTLFNPKVLLIADCHNATFRSPWIKIPAVIAILNRCSLVLVHNESVKEQAIALGINSKYLYVLETRPAQLESDKEKLQKDFPHPWILSPCSFNTDEPINVLLTAARSLPEITFVLTGNTARAQGIHDLSEIPPNVKLTGFVPKKEFDRLLCNTDAVLGLTTLDGIQLSVANEAVGAGKPMILSNTKTLKKLFYKGAIYVDSLEAKSIAQGCQQALSKQQELTLETCELKEERNQRWLKQADQINMFLKNQEVLEVVQ